MTTTTNYGDAEPTAQEQRIAELEEQLAQAEQTTAAYAREAASLRTERDERGDALEASRAECNRWARKVAATEADAASLRAAVDTYAADLARVSAERDGLREQLREAAFMPR